MPRKRLPRLCANIKCQVVETPLWRRGWKLEDGVTFARLCNSCGLHFRKNHYCEHCMQLYKEQDEFDESWLACTSCSRYSHKDCINSASSRGGKTVNPATYKCSDCVDNCSPGKHLQAETDVDCLDESEHEEKETETTLRKRTISVLTIEVDNPARRTRRKTKDQSATVSTTTTTTNSLSETILSDCNYAPKTVVIKRRMSISTVTTQQGKQQPLSTITMKSKGGRSPQQSPSSLCATVQLEDAEKDYAARLLKSSEGEGAPLTDPGLCALSTLWAVCEIELSRLNATFA